MQITNAQDTVPLLNCYGTRKQEHFGVICLDSGYNVISKKVLFKGGVSKCNIDTKVLFWEICKKNAVAIILFHNHPSGSTQPSGLDMETTQIIQKGCEYLGIQLLDHVIIGKWNYFSFCEHGLITENKESAAKVAQGVK